MAAESFTPTADPVADLLAILDLEQLEHNLYRGLSPRSAWQRVFGGQVAAQALVAAQRTVPDNRFVHSLHGYFMRPGDISVPIVYEVERPRDGGSFSTRQVLAIQHGEAIFSLSASFKTDEDGLDHQVSMPEDLPDPETLPGREALMAMMGDNAPDTIRRYWARPRPFELRPVTLDHYTSRRKLAPRQDVWVRAMGPIPQDRSIQAAVLAYLSDMTLLDTATFAHGLSVFDKDVQAASIDHAVWFHRPAPLDDWLLYSQDSPSASGARGFTRGSIFTRDGRLVASVAQEGLIRLKNRQP
ncbi:MAG: acyl-CoA thioesterase II [Methylobacterium mesophilicum]|nr:acyl-CoA thioesterase II [Methylobacterium mesophilicum]